MGIQLLNENHIDEMCQIMDSMQKYVPSLSYEKCTRLPDDQLFIFQDFVQCEILFGGDQLTIARARSSIAVRSNHPTAKERLQGLVPVVEDWHSRMTLMKVSYYLY